MSRRRSFWRDTRGNAATEMALVLPFVLTLLFGGMEAGYFMYSEHKVIEAVRDGVRFGSRQNISDICPNTVANYAATVDRIALMTRTGQIASTTARPIVPGWASNGQVSVTIACNSYLSTGIYSALGSPAGPQGPTITVAATNLTYPSILGSLGLANLAWPLHGRASTAVIGL
jgi:Flp pilus assembly protein TadG